MKAVSKVINLETKTKTTDIETVLNEWLLKGYELVSVYQNGNKTFGILVKRIVE